tara:strand:+ start:3014 stop:3220 length:207 start_codon:yes stop_codon:yes gene_type:complete
MKPTSTFKMPKRTKTMAAIFSFTDEDQRHAFKRMMIQAHLYSEIKPPREKRPGGPGRNAPVDLNSELV